MAAEQSTTEQLNSVKFPTRRRLTVGYLASSAKGHPPHIRLMGRWVEEAGFPIGAQVDVEVSHGRLVIELAPPPSPSEYQTPPPKRAYISERMEMTDFPRRTPAARRTKQGANAP
jgi:Toxin SymE, type I toxin-antitoxin system